MKTQVNSELLSKAEVNEVNYSAEAVLKANEDITYHFFKRLIDIIGSLVGILITLLLIAVFSVVYLFGENKGPMLFKQERIGKNGRKIYIYKFRSMVFDAEKKLIENKALYQKYLNNNYKLEQDEDPRITRFGAFIRKTSLDEFPQFINVLKGEMSLVGPRPIVADELKEYKDKVPYFLSVKPGITGYWQANGRSDIGYPRRVEIELFYVFNQSLQLDVKILFKTVVQVIYRKGAY